MKPMTYGRGLRAAGLVVVFACFGWGPAQPGAEPVHPKLEDYAAIVGAEKIDQSLLAAASAAEKSTGGALADKLASHFARTDTKAGSATLLEVGVKKVDGELLEAVAQAGAELHHANVPYQRITVAVVDAAPLYALADLEEVLWITPVVPPKLNVIGYDGDLPTTVGGMSVSEGASLFGLDGEGQIVGIISDSFALTPGMRNEDTTPGPGSSGVLKNSNSQLLGLLPSGDLPNDEENGDKGELEENDEPFVFLLNDSISFGQATDEGAAMAELVHSIAPGASIAFHSAGNTPGQMAAAIDALVEFGCTVIVDDIGFFGEPIFQTGLISNAAESATLAGVPYFAAAGNQGDDGLRFTYQSVRPQSDTTFPASGNDLHRWGGSGPQRDGYLPIYMEPGSGFTAIVHWNQPWESLNVTGGAQVDLDVYVTLSPNRQGILEAATPTGQQQGRISFSRQGITGVPSGDPWEIVSYGNNTGQPKTVYLAVDHFWGNQSNIPQLPSEPLEVALVFVGKDSGVVVDGLEGASIFGHMWHPSVMTTAAVNWMDTPAFDTNFGPTPEIDPEPFSTRAGEVSGYFSHSGVPGVITSFKPDTTAVNGNNTSFFGGVDLELNGWPNFFGTSAAAPNAAAVAALLRQLNPEVTPPQLRAALVETAIDVTGHRAAPGVDDVSGHGLIDATSAMIYVAENFGAAVEGLEAPNTRVFDFLGEDTEGEEPVPVPDAQGWTPEFPGGFTGPNFELETGTYRVRNPDTVNTLGWLKSPELLASSVDIDPATPPLAIAGGSGPEIIYRAIWQVDSDAASSTDTPTFRMRASSHRFEESHLLSITSGEIGGISPAAGSVREYRQYFQLPATRNRFHLYFDMVSVDPWDAAGVGIGLQEVHLQAFHRGALTGQRLEQPLTIFANNSRGWQPRSGAPLASAGAQVTSDGLRLGPAASADETAFRFWGSPEANPGVHLEVNRLYEAVFSITSDAPAAQRSQLPTFRLRANDSSNQMAVVLDVNSPGTGANVPAAGEKKTYRIFFESIPEIVGNPVNFSFDYLFVPEMGNDPDLEVTLESMVVRSYVPPL